RHLESDYCLVGMRSGKKFRMGDKVRIKVAAANLIKRQLDYDWVPVSDPGITDGEEIARPKSKGKKKR
ncbi:MAG: hypothetical protein ACXWV2_09890, partial [Chitinophagaceae bacterium]